MIHCFGSLGQTGVNNDDVRYICGFYGLPYREDWRREEARDAGDSFLYPDEDGWLKKCFVCPYQKHWGRIRVNS